MSEFDFVLYDTAPFGASADTEHVLFQVAQGADSTHTESFTNMRGSGSLPQDEAFLVNKVGISVDFGPDDNEVDGVWINSFIEVRISDETVFKAPLDRKSVV